MTHSKPQRASIFAATLNASGFPFQYAVVRRAEGLGDNGSPWVLQACEFPVEAQGNHTRIDVVFGLWNDALAAYRRYLVCECKRVNPALSTWLFAQAPYVRRDSKSTDVLVETLQRVSDGSAQGTVYAGYRALSTASEIYHVGTEAKTAKKGDERGYGRGGIEDAATQVLRGLNGLIERLTRDAAILPVNDTVLFLPVIFTTAELWTIKSDLAAGDLRTGEMSLLPEDVVQRKWLWFQYHQSPGLRHLTRTYFQETGAPKTREGLAPVLDREFARTIAVVSTDGIDDFLRAPIHQS